MFSLLVRSTKNLVINNKNIRPISSFISLNSRFTGRDIQDHSHGESGTLAQNIIKYIAIESCKFDPLIPQKIKYSQYYPVNDLRDFRAILSKTDINQLPRLLVYTYTYKTNGEPHKTAQIINEIDNICFDQLNQIDNDEILRILYAFMYLIPNKVSYLDFYRGAMQKLVEKFDDKKLMLKEQFVQVCFYLGLNKKRNNQLMEKFLNIALPHYINDLNRMDFAIVSNSSFKTSTVFTNDEFRKRLIAETIATDPTDDAILVTLLKSLRLNRIKNENINLKLKSILFNSQVIDKYHFKGLVHVFAYFADGFWNEPEICKKIVDICKERLEITEIENDKYAEIPFNDMRAKDITTFLWSCSHLGLNDLTIADLKFFEEIILKKLQNNEYRYSQDDFINTCLSMWMLNYKSKDLITNVIHLNSNDQQRNQSSDRIKLDSRLKLLINCVYLEKPDWLKNTKLGKMNRIFDETREAPQYLIKNRKSLETVNKVLLDDKEEFGIKLIKIVAPIAELNVAGLFVEFEDGRKCFLEVLEQNQILKFNQIPISMVNLKIKILENLSYHVLVVDYNDCQSMESLKETLKNKIDSVPSCLDIKKIAV